MAGSSSSRLPSFAGSDERTDRGGEEPRQYDKCQRLGGDRRWSGRLRAEGPQYGLHHPHGGAKQTKQGHHGRSVHEMFVATRKCGGQCATDEQHRAEGGGDQRGEIALFGNEVTRQTDGNERGNGGKEAAENGGAKHGGARNAGGAGRTSLENR